MIEKAKWIWTSDKETANQYAIFLREFETDDSIQNAEIEIAADTNYELWINDTFVDCGHYYDKKGEKSFDTINVKKYIKKGKNQLLIRVYYIGESTFTYKKGKAGLIFALSVGNNTILSDESVLTRNDACFEQGEGVHKTTAQIGFGFNYDANKNSDEYKKAVVIKNDLVLKERPIKKLKLTKCNSSVIVQQGYCLRRDTKGTTAKKMYSDYLSFIPFEDIFNGIKTMPVRLVGKKNQSEGVYVIIDLQEEKSGFLNIDIETNKGCYAEIAYGEHLEDGRVRSVIAARNFANTYTAKEGKQTFTYYSRRMAMRYIEVHFWNFNKLIINDISVISADYPLPKAKTPMIADELHKRIFDISVRTLKLCMHEHYEDCPWREQSLYGSDSRNAALCTYYAFEDYDFARASLDLFLSEVKENGYFRICAPCDNETTIPSFCFIAPLSLLEYTNASKDLSLARNHWNCIKTLLDSAVETKENGIVCPLKDEDVWIFYEWADDWDEFTENTEGTAKIDGLHILFLSLAIKSCLDLAEALNDMEFIDKYKIIFDNLKTTFNELFWNEDKKLYSSFIVEEKQVRFDELTQSLAVLLGFADEKKKESILQILSHENNLIDITLSYSIYKYKALLVEKEKYKNFVLSDIAKKWGDILYAGATSFWETKDGAAAFENAGSLCHAWSATPIIVYNLLFGN